MPGYTVETCAVHINDCDSNPCSNNGNCTNLVNDFMCECITGYTDANCTIDMMTAVLILVRTMELA